MLQLMNWHWSRANKVTSMSRVMRWYGSWNAVNVLCGLVSSALHWKKELEEMESMRNWLLDESTESCYHSRNSIYIFEHKTILHFTIHSMIGILSMGFFFLRVYGITLAVVNDVDEWCRLECLNWLISWYFDNSWPMVVRHYFPSTINSASNVNTINYYCPTLLMVRLFSVSRVSHNDFNSFRCIRFGWFSRWTFNFRFPISCHWSQWRREKIMPFRLAWWEQNQCIEVCFRSVSSHKQTLSYNRLHSEIHQNHKKEEFSFIDAHTITLTERANSTHEIKFGSIRAPNVLLYESNKNNNIK